MSMIITLSFALTHTHTHRLRICPNRVVSQDSDRQAEKKQAEAVQLEQRMNEMENTMKELEQRYACLPRLRFSFAFTFL